MDINAIHPVKEKPPLWHNNEKKSKKTGLHSTIYMCNGDRYIGEWHQDKKQGKGTYYYKKSGCVYKGAWINDERHGYGTLSVRKDTGKKSQSRRNTHGSHDTSVHPNDDDDDEEDVHDNVAGLYGGAGKRKRGGNEDLATMPLRKVYAGDWQYDLMHGFGTYFYQDESHYEGEWQEGKRTGWGVMYYLDGSRYEGEWYRNRRHGQGVLLLGLIVENGDRYEGMWFNDEKEGPGKFVYKQKRQLYKGEWSGGVPRCGMLIDLPSAKMELEYVGIEARRNFLPPIGLADPAGVLSRERENILEERVRRLLPQRRQMSPGVDESGEAGEDPDTIDDVGGPSQGYGPGDDVVALAAMAAQAPIHTIRPLVTGDKSRKIDSKSLHRRMKDNMLRHKANVV